jgi:Zn-dependent peptidase ImmA (M78 family)
VIPIGSVDWNAIRSEYIGGGTSYRKLAKKYGVSINTLSPLATAEGWVKMRQEAQDKATAKALQKTADIAADNATIAARIRTKLLRKLEREIDALPDMIGSETRNSVTENEFSQDGKRIQKVKEAAKSFKLRDLAAAYKDLTADMVQTEQAGNELLQSLLDLERRAES